MMRKSLLALLGVAVGSGAAVLIYRNWRHIIRRPLKLPPATYAVGVERDVPIEVEHGLTLAADQTILHGREHPSALILPEINE